MITFIKSCKLGNDWPSGNGDVVFVGRSNVGKSSFINALYNQNLARVGKTAGKTRLLNFFDINGQYIAVDVPGYGFANRSEKELIDFGTMMDNYFANREGIKLVVMLVDIRHKPTKDDIEMLEYLQSFHKKVLVVANKSDKLSYSQSLKAIQLISDTLKISKNYILKASALKKTNMLEIRQYIENCFTKEEADEI